MLDKKTWIVPLTLIVSVIACQGLNPSGTTPPTSTGPGPTAAGFVAASISGHVWEDECDSGADGEAAFTLTPPGCVAEASAIGPYHADGGHQSDEPGIGGVTVKLMASVCPGTQPLDTALTDPDGAYTFAGLDAGDYCVTVDAGESANQAGLLPGLWTQPSLQTQTITADVAGLHAGEAAGGVDFGWDRQFAPKHVHATAWDNDGHLQIFDTGIAFQDQAPPSLGLFRQAGAAAGQVFVLSSNPPAVMVETADGPHQLGFTGDYPDYGLAVFPGQGDQPPQLAWSSMPQGSNGQASIFVSHLDGSNLRTVYSETIDPGAFSHLVVRGWSADGATLLFSREPLGIGGYIPFDGASSLYQLQLSDGQVTPVIEYDPQGRGILCLDARSPDGSLVASHCPPTSISLLSPSGGSQGSIAAPADITGSFLVGSARFSPDGTRVAFAIARGDPTQEMGWVALSDGLSGASHTIFPGQPGGFYNVAGWLNASTLLLQWRAIDCGPDCHDSLWTVGIDGQDLTKVLDGSFLGLTNLTAP
jgi:SdrD B-like domain